MAFGSRLLAIGLLAAGGALIVAGVIAAPKALRAARPTLRGVMKSTMRVYARVRSAAAEFSEDMEDLFAEVKAELASERPPDGEAGNPAPEAQCEKTA
jgi:hypothetical protein